MDVKGTFDHVSKGQLLKRMLELGIDGDLATWTSHFSRSKSPTGY